MTTPCVCDPETGVRCMLHFDLDAYILNRTLGSTDETLSNAETQSDRDTFHDLDQ